MLSIWIKSEKILKDSGKHLGFNDTFTRPGCGGAAGAHYPYHSEPMSIPRSLWIPI